MRQIKLWPKTVTTTHIGLSDDTLRTLLKLPKRKGEFKSVTWNGYTLQLTFEKETHTTLTIK
jgi:hypothetical protein